jgi:hypothetical protein
MRRVMLVGKRIWQRQGRRCLVERALRVNKLTAKVNEDCTGDRYFLESLADG